MNKPLTLCLRAWRADCSRTLDLGAAFDGAKRAASVAWGRWFSCEKGAGQPPQPPLRSKGGGGGDRRPSVLRSEACLDVERQGPGRRARCLRAADVGSECGCRGAAATRAAGAGRGNLAGVVENAKRGVVWSGWAMLVS